MSRIERVQPESFFAEFLLPLRRSNARKAVHYLKLDREPTSYWMPVATRTGGIRELSADKAGGAALIEELGGYWAAQGDSNLPKLVSHLLALRRGIVESGPAEEAAASELSDFVYPLA